MTPDDSKIHLPLLPTGKPHISFSEFANWLECPFRHKLLYVDGLGTFDGNEHTFFGTHVHWGCETYINQRRMPTDDALEKIAATWDERGFSDKDVWIEQARGILDEVPGWMDQTFPGWKPIAAEEKLYESLDHVGHAGNHWKGYVDAAIVHPGKGKWAGDILRIIDWKTTAWGWSVQRQREFKTNAQAAAYKVFWSRKFDTPLKDIRTGYVLLKRTANPGKRCQLIEVSVGPKMVERLETNISKMLRAVKSGHAPKNKLSCRFCEFNATEHCEGVGNRLR